MTGENAQRDPGETFRHGQGSTYQYGKCRGDRLRPLVARAPNGRVECNAEGRQIARPEGAPQENPE